MRGLLERLEAANDRSDYADVPMLQSTVSVLEQDCSDILAALRKLPRDGQLPTWWISKVSVAAADISAARDYLHTQVKGDGK